MLEQAENGNAEAMRKLVILFSKEGDLEEAIQCHEQAAKKGNAKAIEILKNN